MLTKAPDHEYCGGNIPYGFMLRDGEKYVNKHGKVKKYLVPQPEESKIYRFIKELYGSGWSLVASAILENWMGGREPRGRYGPRPPLSGVVRRGCD